MSEPEPTLEELLSELGGSGNRKPLHEDYNVSELICRFTLNYFSKQPNPPAGIIDIIIGVAGFKEPCNHQQILKNAIAPLAEDYKETEYARLFGEDFNDCLISKAFIEKETRLVKAISVAILQALKSQVWERTYSERLRSSSFYKKLQDIAELFDLSDDEREICAFASIKLAYTEFFMISHYLTEDSRTYFSAPDGFEKTRCYADFFSFNRQTFEKLTAPDGRLFKLGIIEDDMEFSRDLNDYLFSNGFTYLRNRFFGYHKASARPFTQNGVTESQFETIKAIIESRSSGQNINILVESPWDKPNTEFVIKLADSLGYQLLNIAKANDSYCQIYKNMFRVQAIYAAQKHASANEKVALLIESADMLLDKRCVEDDGSYLGQTGVKFRTSVMTELLTHGSAVQFWLTSSLAEIDPYIRHLFDYAFVPVAEGFEERLDFWQKTVEKYSLADLFDLEDIKRFSARFQLDQGLIDAALRNATNLLKHGWKKRRLCKHIEELLNGTSQMDSASSCATSALPDAELLVPPHHLNIEPEADFQLLLDTLKHSQQQLKPEGFKIAILISGLPGTGKTYLARYIADVLNRKLILKTAGSVLDKASLRRFDFHFHVGSLKPQGNVIFYKTLLAPFALGKMARSEANQLAEMIDLTPSDFGSLRQRLLLLPNVKKSHAELLQGLIDRRKIRLGIKPEEISKIDEAKYLLQAQRVGE